MKISRKTFQGKNFQLIPPLSSFGIYFPSGCKLFQLNLCFGGRLEMIHINAQNSGAEMSGFPKLLGHFIHFRKSFSSEEDLKTYPPSITKPTKNVISVDDLYFYWTKGYNKPLNTTLPSQYSFLQDQMILVCRRHKYLLSIYKDFMEIENVLNKGLKDFVNICFWFLDNKLSIHFGESKTKLFLCNGGWLRFYFLVPLK